jgi:outer membrane scaffolding protein for murein synthesis (MipA/OmpV family)
LSIATLTIKECMMTRNIPGFSCFIWLVLATLPDSSRPVFAQTPSPLQEWQYSSGIVLEQLFEPVEPDWTYVAGLATEFKPLYDGSQPYRVVAGPVIDIRYRDVAFASVGEGLGLNLLRGTNYRAGIALDYDLGRRVSDDESHLHGLGDIHAAPVVKVFGSYVISKQFPLVLRLDARQFVGGAEGAVADVQAYLPLPGSSKTLVMFAGPSLTLADHRFMQTEFGVTRAQSLASGYPIFDAHGGANAAGLGFTANYFVAEHWILNVDAAFDHLLAAGNDSPITRRSLQRIVVLSAAYKF